MAGHEQDVGAGGEMGKETAFLNNVTNSRPNLWGVGLIQFRPFEKNSSLIRLEQGDHEPEEGRFPAATRSNHRGR